MKFSQFLTGVYKAICITASAVLFLLGSKILLDFLYVKGALVMVCSGILILLLFQKVSLMAWVQTIIVIAVAVRIISQVAKI
jgi:hypothetical protein